MILAFFTHFHFKFGKFRRHRNTQSSDWHALVGRVHKPGTFRFCFVDKIPVLLQVKRISSLPSKVSLSTSHTHCISLCVAQWNQIISEEEFSFPFFHTFSQDINGSLLFNSILEKIEKWYEKRHECYFRNGLSPLWFVLCWSLTWLDQFC